MGVAAGGRKSTESALPWFAFEGRGASEREREVQ